MSTTDARIQMDILVIDDDPGILASVGDFLKVQGHRVHLARGGAEGLDVLRRNAVDIVITDILMPGVDGFEVLREARRISPGAEAIVITGHRDLENAFRAMREGAFDFFTKPFSVQELNASLRRTVRFRALQREKDRVQERLDRIDAEARGRYGLAAIVGESPSIQEVRGLIRQVCETDATTVLICGETGTGKELVARAIHTESARAGGPFVAVDCSAVTESLFESAFYGHLKGAFTDAREDRRGYFELASGGTLFLDEVGDMDVSMQAKLLRTLEERRVWPVGGSSEIPVDVRVVGVTNLDLPKAVAEGRFREDLFYRLNVFAIRAPALRERPEDIVPIAEHFLRRYARELRRPGMSFAPEAADLLRSHSFPGNVRELRNLIERAAILCRSDRVTAEDLRFDPLGASAREGPQMPRAPSPEPAGVAPAGEPPVISIRQRGSLNLSALEQEAIQEALRRCEGNKARAAGLLGLSRQALIRRMEAYGM